MKTTDRVACPAAAAVNDLVPPLQRDGGIFSNRLRCLCLSPGTETDVFVLIEL